MSNLSVTLPNDLVQDIAERAAALVIERQGTATEDGWLRGVERIASYIDSPTSRVYALSSAGRLPVERDGSALIARRSEMDRWLRDGGAIRP